MTHGGRREHVRREIERRFRRRIHEDRDASGPGRQSSGARTPGKRNRRGRKPAPEPPRRRRARSCGAERPSVGDTPAGARADGSGGGRGRAERSRGHRREPPRPHTGSGKAAQSSATVRRTLSATAGSPRDSRVAGDRVADGRPSRRSPMPRVVMAGVPMRMPEATSGGRVSNGIVFLFTVMPDAFERLLGFLAGEAARRRRRRA